MVKKIVLAPVAGVIGGLVNSLGVWASGASGVSAGLGFQMTPALTLPWLAPRLVQGGIWGLAFLLPFWKNALSKKGILLGVAQALVMLLVIFPRMGKGMLGLQLGLSAPLFVLFFTACWGLSAAAFLKAVR